MHYHIASFFLEKALLLCFDVWLILLLLELAIVLCSTGGKFKTKFGP